MQRVNPTGRKQVLPGRHYGGTVFVSAAGVVDDAEAAVPSDWPAAQQVEYTSKRVFAIIHTFGDAPHLEAAMASVADEVDGFILFYGSSWSGRSRGAETSLEKAKKICQEFRVPLISEDCTGNRYSGAGQPGQFEQRTAALKYLEYGDWAFILDDDEVWEAEEFCKFALKLRTTKAVSYTVDVLAFYQTFEFIGWEEKFTRASRKVPGAHYVNANQIADYTGRALPAEDSGCRLLHFSWVDSDDAIFDKFTDYSRRAARGQFKQLKVNVWEQWIQNRRTPLIGQHVHPLVAWQIDEKLRRFTGSLPEAAKRSPFYTARLHPQLSIVCVTYNSQNVLQDMVSSLLAYAPAIDYELIFVDNASTATRYLEDEMARLARMDIPVSLIQNQTNTKFTHAANQGMRQARGEYILLLNPDVVFFQPWFSQLREEMDKHKWGIIAPKMIYPDKRIHFAGGAVSAGRYSHIGRDAVDTGEWDAPSEQPWVTGACFMIHRRVYAALGGLDEKYPHYESDNKYCERARAQGFVVGYSGAASTIIHLCGRSSA